MGVLYYPSDESCHANPRSKYIRIVSQFSPSNQHNIPLYLEAHLFSATGLTKEPTSEPEIASSFLLAVKDMKSWIGTEPDRNRGRMWAMASELELITTE